MFSTITGNYPVNTSVKKKQANSLIQCNNYKYAQRNMKIINALKI